MAGPIQSKNREKNSRSADRKATLRMHNLWWGRTENNVRILIKGELSYYKCPYQIKLRSLTQTLTQTNISKLNEVLNSILVFDYSYKEQRLENKLRAVNWSLYFKNN